MGYSLPKMLMNSSTLSPVDGTEKIKILNHSGIPNRHISLTTRRKINSGVNTIEHQSASIISQDSATKTEKDDKYSSLASNKASEYTMYNLEEYLDVT